MMTDTPPSKHHDPSAPVSSFYHLSYSSSLISQASSEEDTSLYALALAQDTSDIDLPSQSDIIIAYVDSTFKFVSKIQNTTVSLAQLERVKVQSVSCALIKIFLVMPFTDTTPRSLLIELLELKRLKLAMIWNLVLTKSKLSVASTRSKIVG